MHFGCTLTRLPSRTSPFPTFSGSGVVGTYVIGTDVGVELGSVPEPTEQPEIKQTTAKNRAIAALKQLGQEDFFCIKQNSFAFKSETM